MALSCKNPLRPRYHYLPTYTTAGSAPHPPPPTLTVPPCASPGTLHTKQDDRRCGDSRCRRQIRRPTTQGRPSLVFQLITGPPAESKHLTQPSSTNTVRCIMICILIATNAITTFFGQLPPFCELRANHLYFKTFRWLYLEKSVSTCPRSSWILF